MKPNVSGVGLAVLSSSFFCEAASSERAIPARDPITDADGFNIQVINSEAPSAMLVVVRHLAGAVITLHARFRDMVPRKMTLEGVMETRALREFEARFPQKNASPTTANTIEPWVRCFVC